jgi:hypothetical protein
MYIKGRRRRGTWVGLRQPGSPGGHIKNQSAMKVLLMSLNQLIAIGT